MLKNISEMPGSAMAITFIAMAVVVFTLFVVITGCTSASDISVSRQVQQDVMVKANAAVPAYQPNVFPARQSINRYLRETEKDGEWYTYALNMLGEPLFYIISDYKPINICISLTAPDRLANHSSVAISAPALDGVYYGGAGCNAYYMFDANTGGMIELAGDTFTLVSSRVPLFLETDIRRLTPETVQSKPEIDIRPHIRSRVTERYN